MSMPTFKIGDKADKEDKPYNPYSHKRSECRGDDKYPWRTVPGYMGPHDEDYED